MSHILLAVFTFALLLGCNSGGSQAPPNMPPSVPTYRQVADVKQTMQWILDPAADVIWDSAGWIVTADGETDLAPTTEEGWEHVRNNAAVVAETGNLLMMPGRVGGPDWVAYAQGLRVAGKVAMDAAEAHDAGALFDAGGQLYQVCRACHQQYLVPLEEARPSQ